MNNSFHKLNCLNSFSIEEVKHFSATTSPIIGLPNESTIFPYFSRGEVEFASEWKFPQFDYVLNHLGFRNKTIPNEVELAAFGCSFTFGTGLPVDSLWHSILASNLNVSSANYGVPGASIKSILDVALIISKHIKIKKAVFLLPAYSRIQIAKTSPFKDEVNYLSVIPNHNSELTRSYGIDTELIIKATPDEEMLKVTRDSLYLVDYIFKQRGIATYYSSWDIETYNFIREMDLEGTVLPNWTSTSEQQAKSDLARDKLHPGLEHHYQFANKIIEYIK
jgi:hypothetical protein